MSLREGSTRNSQFMAELLSVQHMLSLSFSATFSLRSTLRPPVCTSIHSIYTKVSIYFVDLKHSSGKVLNSWCRNRHATWAKATNKPLPMMSLGSISCHVTSQGQLEHVGT